MELTGKPEVLWLFGFKTLTVTRLGAFADTAHRQSALKKRIIVSSSPTSSEVTQRKYGTIGLILLAVGLLALFEALYSSDNSQVLRLIAGRGAIPLALTIILLGLYFTFYPLPGTAAGPPLVSRSTTWPRIDIYR